MAERAGVGNILSQTFALAARKAVGLFGLALLFAVSTRALSWTAFGSVPFVLQPMPASASISFPLAMLLQQCADQLIQFAVSAAMLWLLLSDTASPEPARDRADVIGPLAVYSLIMWAVVSVGFALQYGLAFRPLAPAALAIALASVVWGIAVLYAIIGLWVTVPVIIVERLGAIAAFRRSWSLTKGHRGAIFGVVLILIVGFAVPLFLLRALGGYGMTAIQPIPLWSPVGAVSLLLQLSVIVLMAAATVVIYRELRRVKDGIPEGDVFG